MQTERFIGNTPLIKIRYRYQGEERWVFAKLEYYNLSGSIKDRIAFYILKEAKKRGNLKEGQAIIEATSGNTGISFAALGARDHHPVHIFMPDWVSKERVNIIKLYGAHVHLVSKEEGGFREAIKRADYFAKEINGYRPDQFCNPDNVLAHYYTTGKEIIDKLGTISGFVSGIGTGGTLMGVAMRIKEVNPYARVIALEPSGLPLLTTGNAIGSHKIEGIGDDFIPAIVDRTVIDEVVVISDEDAIQMARKLSLELGLGVGISSGANFLVAATHSIPNLVTVFADDAKKYLSTDLTKEQDLNPHFLSNQIELLNFDIL